MLSFYIVRWFQSSLTYDICGPHWWLRSCSCQASEGYKLKAECLFLICLELLFSLYCNFWHIFRRSDKKTKGERKRTTTTKLDCSQSPIFPFDRRDRALTAAIFVFKQRGRTGVREWRGFGGKNRETVRSLQRLVFSGSLIYLYLVCNYNIA